jgi:hypothetical protein
MDPAPMIEASPRPLTKLAGTGDETAQLAAE